VPCNDEEDFMLHPHQTKLSRKGCWIVLAYVLVIFNKLSTVLEMVVNQYATSTADHVSAIRLSNCNSWRGSAALTQELHHRTTISCVYISRSNLHAPNQLCNELRARLNAKAPAHQLVGAYAITFTRIPQTYKHSQDDMAAYDEESLVGRIRCFPILGAR
jgi:hypothetical protein